MLFVGFIALLIGLVSLIFMFRRRVEHGPWHFQCYVPGVTLVLMGALFLVRINWMQSPQNILFLSVLGILCIADAALGGKSWSNGRLYISGFGCLLIAVRLIVDYLS